MHDDTLVRVTVTRRTLLQVLAGASLFPFHCFAESAPKKGGQALIGYTNEPAVLNPLTVGLSVDQGVWWTLYSPLWAIDENGEFVPRLAKEVPTVANGGISADGLRWRIRLREGVKWHDGQPFTAADVAYTISLIQNPKFKAVNRSGHMYVKEIQVVNDHELTWTMSEPFSPYLSLLSWTFIVPEHIVASADDPNNSSLNSKPIGTGPFKFAERVTGDHVTVEANPEHFGEGPYLDRIIFKYIPDMNAMYHQFESGSVDYYGLSGIGPDKYAGLKAMPNKSVYISDLPAVMNITLNVGNEILSSKSVRHALYYAMDKQPVIDELYYGLPPTTESYLPSGNWAYKPDLPKHEFNPEKAKELLEAEGWKVGAGGIRAKNGKRLELVLATTAGNPTQEQTQLLLQQNWQDVGVAVTINNMPGAVIWGDYWLKSQYDMLLTYTNVNIASDPNPMQRFGSKSIPAQGGTGYNVYQYQNPELDELMDAALRTSEIPKRREYYFRTQEIMRDALVMLPLFQMVMIEATDSRLKGFKGNVNVLANTWNANTWHWEK
ncbi:peptide ABC transporter substrate-binding protein [Verticiella sediminum]|uniref:Peptide ABC transporter substrate-binding protein n=1 Tax=Verticiella sediminum TaxID=1247510 RepID=A0A556AQ00_9BURK|nr:peptide ABC transporter substrate-binding protein [Verticiella sediminum]TSH94978.1 peptide ABC transporter substrate-binding protein [Verticiella sediminum]